MLFRIYLTLFLLINQDALLWRARTDRPIEVNWRFIFHGNSKLSNSLYIQSIIIGLLLHVNLPIWEKYVERSLPIIVFLSILTLFVVFPSALSFIRIWILFQHFIFVMICTKTVTTSLFLSNLSSFYFIWTLCSLLRQ